MSLGSLALSVWLILVGLEWLTWITVSAKFLGAWALVTGILLIVEHWRPLVIPFPLRRTPEA